MMSNVIRPADVCLPFTVRVGEGVGRYVVATRDIKAGQVMIVATMLMIATMMMDDENDVCGFGIFLVVDKMYLCSAGNFKVHKYVHHQVILEDRPACLGPCFDTEAVCVECLGFRFRFFQVCVECLGRPDGSVLCHLCQLPLCRCCLVLCCMVWYGTMVWYGMGATLFG